MTEEATIGSRVECEGAKGIVKWVGNIPSVKGIWYGIDWDDEKRGKHNGSHQGTQYFKTRGENSGSFVRSSKLNFGMTLEEAIKGRYQNDVTIEEVLTSQLKRNINARFVEVVGMDKIGKLQSQLDALQTVVLDGWLVKGCGNTNLGSMLPRIQDLDVSNSLLSSWEDIAKITKQLPALKMLNISGNLLQKPQDPQALVESTKHIHHVVMNKMITYTWDDLVLCAKMFPNVEKIQLAYNKLEKLGKIPNGVFEHLKDIDIGVNPITDWKEVCHLAYLPKLEIMNMNSCKLKMIEFPDTAPGGKTEMFASLSSIMISNNPLACWECVGEMDKLESLTELILSHEEVSGRGNYSMEFTFGRIRNLQMLNRTKVTPREKRDYQLFYLRTFSNEYYSNGGAENLDDSKLTDEFLKKHPSYLSVARIVGAPVDERSHQLQKSQKLRDMKLSINIVPQSPSHSESIKSFLPNTKISKVKMMIKRLYKLSGSLNITLYYSPSKENKDFEIVLDNDMQELKFYSIQSGDTINVRW